MKPTTIADTAVTFPAALSPADIEALADSLSDAANALHKRIMAAIRKNASTAGAAISHAEAQELFEQEIALRQQANSLYADVTGFAARGAALPVRELLDLAVRLNARVESLTHDGTRYVVTTDTRVFEADSVVVATGSFQRPKIPPLAASLSPRIHQLHSSEYHNPFDLPEGAVLVVGAALLLQSFWRLHSAAPGFTPDGLVVTPLQLPLANYGTPAQQARGELAESRTETPLCGSRGAGRGRRPWDRRRRHQLGLGPGRRRLVPAAATGLRDGHPADRPATRRGPAPRRKSAPRPGPARRRAAGSPYS